MTNPNEAIQCITGEGCWCFDVGGGLGGLTIRFGECVRTHLTGRITHNTGEYNLWITTSWRLDWRNQVLATHNDPSAKVTEHEHLLGKRVLSIGAIAPAWDLDILFEDDMRLRVFCDRPESWGVGAEDEDTTSWYAYTPEKTLVMVGPMGRWATDDAGVDWP